MPIVRLLRTWSGPFALSLLLAAGADAQSERWTAGEPLRTPRPLPEPSPGHRLYSPRPGTSTHLVDSAGKIVHTWPSNYVVGPSVYLRDNGNLLRSIVTSTANPLRVLNGGGGGVQEQAFDGTVLWDFRYDTGGVLLHHDLVPMPNGNVLLMVWEIKTAADAIAAGRDPALVSGDVYPDHLIEVQPTGPTTGTIVWKWHVWDHLVQDFDPTKANYGVVADHPELIDVNLPSRPAGELHHFNGMDYDPIHDWIVVSARSQHEIWIIDHSTTTAEAAGHTGGRYGKGGDLLYRWGNPQNYGRGTPADQKLFGQHDPRFVLPGYPGEGHVTVFNNQAPTGSEVDEIVLPVDAMGSFTLAPGAAYGPAEPVWSYSAPGFQSDFMSSAERLPTGHTLICSSLQGRIFEIDPIGRILWEHSVPGGINAASFHAHYTERTLWTTMDTLSASGGGSIGFEVVAGSRSAGRSYMLLGSYSGTSPGIEYRGFHIPLNPDSYTSYMSKGAAAPFHMGAYGILDGLGRATATLTLGPGVATGFVGTTFHHASVTFRPQGLQVTAVSNPDPFVFVP